MAGSPKRDGKNPGPATKQRASSNQQNGGAGLDRVIQAQIGDKLRSLYGELVEQPVPERFTAILDRLSTGRREA
jgi:hypothetical protein